MKTLIRNIGKLVGIVPEGTLRKEGPEMGKVGSLDNAWLLIDGEKIDSFGQEGDSRYGTAPEAARIIDAAGGYVMPSFCDSHSHIVYAGSRYGEFRDKIDGLTYEQIAARGGGILNSADLLHKTSEEELFRQSLERAAEVMNMGTGALEIKSGYGLNTEDELKMLRVIRQSGRDQTAWTGIHTPSAVDAGSSPTLWTCSATADSSPRKRPFRFSTRHRHTA